MQDLVIKLNPNNPFTPGINFNIETGIFEIDGESYMEDSVIFYGKITDWLNDFFKNYDKNVIFNIKLSYFNTSSSKCLLEMLFLIKEYLNKGRDIIVNWKHSDADPDFEDEISDFEYDSGVKINIV